jgi:hypothetical protein
VNGTSQPVSLERKGTCQSPQIVKILVPGVRESKGDHHLRLLDDESLARIGHHPWSWLVEQDWQKHVLDARFGRIAETNVDYDVDAGAGDGRDRPETQSAVFERLAY